MSEKPGCKRESDPTPDVQRETRLREAWIAARQVVIAARAVIDRWNRSGEPAAFTPMADALNDLANVLTWHEQRARGAELAIPPTAGAPSPQEGMNDLAQALDLLREARVRICRETAPSMHEAWAGSVVDRIDAFVKRVESAAAQAANGGACMSSPTAHPEGVHPETAERHDHD